MASDGRPAIGDAGPRVVVGGLWWDPYQLPRCGTGGSFRVEGVLQDHHRSGLVDDRPRRAGRPPGGAQRRGRGHGGEALIDETDSDRVHPLGNPNGELPYTLRSWALAAVQADWQTQDHLERLGIHHQRHQSVEVTFTPGDGLHGGGQDAGGVAARDADAGLPRIHAEAYAGSHAQTNPARIAASA